MSGIVFLSTQRLDEIAGFYRSEFDMTTFLEQEDCVILRHDNLLLGFCQRDRADNCGIITFYYGSDEDVDAKYDQLRELAEGAPKHNERYRIYHFFLRDPEGRRVEVQRFWDLIG